MVVSPRSARLAAWERPQEITTCDLNALRSAHHNLNIHKMKVASARGRGHLDMSRVEREAEVHRKRSESMRISRRKHREAALADTNNENVKLVERLVTVMKESEKRIRSMTTPREPAPRHPEAGSMNIGYRRKVAQHIKCDNEKLFDRLTQVQGTLATKSQLAERYDLHKELVARTSRMRRRWDAEPPPELDFASSSTRPQTPRERPPLHAPKQSSRSSSTLERRANNASGSSRSQDAHAAGRTPSRPSSRASAPAAPRGPPLEHPEAAAPEAAAPEDGPQAAAPEDLPQADETERHAETRAHEEADERESGYGSFETESRSSRSRSSSSRASSRSGRSRSSSPGGSRGGARDDSAPSGSKPTTRDSARPDSRGRPAAQPVQPEGAAEKDEEEEEFEDDFDEASEQEASDQEHSFEEDESASESSAS